MRDNKIQAGDVRYPKDVYTAFTKASTLSIAAELFPAEGKDGDSPYTIYKEPFSRFVFTIIRKEGQKKQFVNGNISINEIADIVAKSQAAQNAEVFLKLPFINQLFNAIKGVNKLVKGVSTNVESIVSYLTTGVRPQQRSQQAQQANNSPDGRLANSVTIYNGTFKGKTPAQVLKEDPNNVGALQKQYAWLEKNVARYPNNKQQMDAIQEAILMLNANQLGDDNVDEIVSFGDVVLFTPSPRALIRKRDQNGYCPVYEIGIIYHLGDDYPVEVSISNYKAPVVQRNNGLINPDRSKAINREKNTFRLSSSQFNDMIYRMSAHMRRFENLYAEYQFKQSKDAYDLNLQASKEPVQRYNQQPPQYQNQGYQQNYQGGNNGYYNR